MSRAALSPHRPAALPTGLRRWARTSGLEPTLRLAGWGLRMGGAAAAARLGMPFRSEARRAAQRTLVRDDGLTRLVAILGSLRGAFAKAGQFASLRHDLVPEAAHRALASLQDRVPPLPLHDIEAALRNELGDRYTLHFESLEAEPLGAASIAQVHRGRLRDGRVVAVKVQYPWIDASLQQDLGVLERAVRLFARLAGRPIVDLPRLFDEFGRGLRGELDFRNEASAARAIGRNLAGDSQVAVPEIVDALTTRRVLTMEFRPAVRIDDFAALERIGAEPAAVVRILARAYAKQVFIDGLFHADPHPGNLFVLEPEGDAPHPTLLFVDFGLSRSLDPQLRRAMRAGLLALVQRDTTTFVDRMDDMGMIDAGARPGVEAAVRQMFERLAAKGGALGLKSQQVGGLKDEAKRLLQDTPGLQLPNDLLLYAKTLTYLFALGERMAPEEDLMKLTLPHLLQFMAQKDPEVTEAASSPKRRRRKRTHDGPEDRS